MSRFNYEEYLGDGLYAGFDGYQIWLYTPEGNEVALEPEVFGALLSYHSRLVERLMDERIAQTEETK